MCPERMQWQLRPVLPERADDATRRTNTCRPCTRAESLSATDSLLRACRESAQTPAGSRVSPTWAPVMGRPATLDSHPGVWSFGVQAPNSCGTRDLISPGVGTPAAVKETTCSSSRKCQHLLITSSGKTKAASHM